MVCCKVVNENALFTFFYQITILLKFYARNIPTKHTDKSFVTEENP
jgi:hypothetical protein